MDRVQAGNLLLVAVVWGMAGALFGSLFAGVHQVQVLLGMDVEPSILVASGLVAMTTAAFYSAMRLALVGAAAGAMVSVASLIATGHQTSLLAVAALAAAAGLLVGGFYSWLVREESRPLAQTLAGLIAGLLAGGLIASPLVVLGLEPGMFSLTASVVAVSAGCFQAIRYRVAVPWGRQMPVVFSSPPVAALIAGIVGASIWIMGGATAGALGQYTLGAIDVVLEQVPAGLSGGLLGGAVAGVVLELLGMNPRYDA